MLCRTTLYVPLFVNDERIDVKRTNGSEQTAEAGAVWFQSVPDFGDGSGRNL